MSDIDYIGPRPTIMTNNFDPKKVDKHTIMFLVLIIVGVILGLSIKSYLKEKASIETASQEININKNAGAGAIKISVEDIDRIVQQLKTNPVKVSSTDISKINKEMKKNPVVISSSDISRIVEQFKN